MRVHDPRRRGSASSQTFDFRLGSSGEAETSGRPRRGSELQRHGRHPEGREHGRWIDAPLEARSARRGHAGPSRRPLHVSRNRKGARDPGDRSCASPTRIGIGPDLSPGRGGARAPARRVPVPIPALTFAQLRRGLQAGYHLSQGLEIPLPADLTAQVTGYLHTYTGLVDIPSNATSRIRGAIRRERAVARSAWR